MAKVRKHQFVAKGDKVLWLKKSPRTVQKWFHSGTSVTRGTDHPPPRHTHKHIHFSLGIPLQFFRFRDCHLHTWYFKYLLVVDDF